MLGRVAHAVHHERGVLLEISLAEHLRVDHHDQVTPVLRRELAFDGGADERTGEELDDERQVAALVTTIESSDGTTVENFIRVLGQHAVLVLSRTIREFASRGLRLEHAEPAVRARGHVEHHGAFGRGNAHADRVGAENSLRAPGRGDEFRGLREADGDHALVGDGFAIIPERPRGRARVARPHDPEPVFLRLFVRHARRFGQNKHTLRFLTVDRRRKLRFVRHHHRLRVRRHREPVRRHLDDPLVVPSQLRVHEHVQNHLGVLFVVPDPSNRLRRRRLQLFDRHHRRARRRHRRPSSVTCRCRRVRDESLRVRELRRERSSGVHRVRESVCGVDSARECAASRGVDRRPIATPGSVIHSTTAAQGGMRACRGGGGDPCCCLRPLGFYGIYG